MMEEKIVQAREDICWALKELLNGNAVFCSPSLRPLLEYEARKVKLHFYVEDETFGYLFIPIGGQQ